VHPVTPVFSEGVCRLVRQQISVGETVELILFTGYRTHVPDCTRVVFEGPITSAVTQPCHVSQQQCLWSTHK